jgi:hypothetical protein
VEKTLDGGIKEERLHEATGGGDDAASGGDEKKIEALIWVVSVELKVKFWV